MKKKCPKDLNNVPHPDFQDWQICPICKETFLVRIPLILCFKNPELATKAFVSYEVECLVHKSAHKLSVLAKEVSWI